MPAKYDLTPYRGDTFQLLVRLRGAAANDYIDLTGRTASAQVRSTETSVPTQGSLIKPFTCTIQDQATMRGGILVEMASADTAALTNGFWDLQVTTTATGFVTTYLAGKVTPTGEVTQ